MSCLKSILSLEFSIPDPLPVAVASVLSTGQTSTVNLCNRFEFGLQLHRALEMQIVRKKKTRQQSYGVQTLIMDTPYLSDDSDLSHREEGRSVTAVVDWPITPRRPA